MRALSIQQPWAWAILNGKDIENRTWSTRYRGKILIHAGKTFDNDGYEWLLENRHILQDELPHSRYFNLAMGGIVGETRIVDCVNSHSSPWFCGPWGFVLADTQPIPFTRCRGRLGFFDVPSGIFYRREQKQLPLTE